MYNQAKKNNVEAQNQLKSDCVKFYNKNGKGIRVMFAGNSITIHDIKKEIGWLGEWGMAASKKENDYVHILMKKILQSDADASFCICHVSDWEKNYKSGHSLFDMYKNAKEFNADIVVARFVENCPIENFEGEVFKNEYEKFADYLCNSEKASLIYTGGFWKHPGNVQIADIAAERKVPFVELSDLGEADDMKAIGLFSHNGVANHPGDKGMKTIADRIWNVLENTLQLIAEGEK